MARRDVHETSRAEKPSGVFPQNIVHLQLYLGWGLGWADACVAWRACQLHPPMSAGGSFHAL